MNNISGNAGGWAGAELVETETIQPVKEEKVVIEYSPEIKDLQFVADSIAGKYETTSNKNVYDALISVEAAIKSLKN